MGICADVCFSFYLSVIGGSIFVARGVSGGKTVICIGNFKIFMFKVPCSVLELFFSRACLLVRIL